jgi:hypothetical protein
VETWRGEGSGLREDTVWKGNRGGRVAAAPSFCTRGRWRPLTAMCQRPVQRTYIKSRCMSKEKLYKALTLRWLFDTMVT